MVVCQSEYWLTISDGNGCSIATGDLDGAKEALSKLKYYVTNSEMLHPLLPEQ